MSPVWDPLSTPAFRPPYRVAVVGCSGAGKSTLAGAIAQALEIPHVELDALFHQPGWQPQERGIFQRETLQRTPKDGQWVACGNYESAVGKDLRLRANHIVLLDLPKRVVMRHMVRRTFGRVRNKQELWNGNRERWSNLFHPIPSQNMILWAWTQWGPYRRRYRKMLQDGAWNHAQVFHCTSEQQVAELLESLTGFGL